MPPKIVLLLKALVPLLTIIKNLIDKPYLSPNDVETVINAFSFSRLDYCNALYVGLDQHLLRRLQLVQNSAACLLTAAFLHSMQIMEFDLSLFQVWINMEKRKESMEKYLCFQTIAPILFSEI